MNQGKSEFFAQSEKLTSGTDARDQGFAVFHEPRARHKIAHVTSALIAAREGRGEIPPPESMREIEVCDIRKMPPKDGFSTERGQARLLHDLANIELQALELGLRTCIEFYFLDSAFIAELEELTLGEARHFQMCLDGLEKLGFPWGTWPVHTSLWKSVSRHDSILDRLLIVHRYQEGGGLDAGETLLRRLSGVKSPVVLPILRQIFEEEVGHVEFGTRWYRHFCQCAGVDSEIDFSRRLASLMVRMPRRLEPLARDLRRRAGFSEGEMATLEFLQKSPAAQDAWLSKKTD